MIRTFQLLLYAVIGFSVIILSMFIIGYMVGWNSDNPKPNELKGALTWHYSSAFGPVKLLKNYQSDSGNGEGKMSQFIFLRGVASVTRENGHPYILNKNNEKLYVEEDLPGESIALPISASMYSAMKIIGVLSFAVALILLIWIGVCLHRFTQSALRKDFFTVSNMKRLQTVGWILTIYGLLSWILTISLPFLIAVILHYKNIDSTSSFIAVLPSMLLAGMLLLLVAKAFANGITLEEDKSSIV